MDRLPVAAVCNEFPFRALLVTPDSNLEQSLHHTQNRTLPNSHELKISTQTSTAAAIKKLMSFKMAYAIRQTKGTFHA
jgi:hypothetical protein